MFTIREKETLMTIIDYADWVSDMLLLKPSEAIERISEIDDWSRMPELPEYVNADLLPLLKSENENGHN